ncbi:MAG TPA: ATP-binding protein [Actinomycetota bacterium]|nr:ATP-binding protein [Actinomycetota bacterium]
MTGPPPPAGGDAPGRLWFGRLGSSILLEVLSALTAALLASSLLTVAISSRLTRSAVRAQSQEIATSALTVLTQTFTQKAQGLTTVLRNLAAQIANQELLDANRRPDLIEELGAGVRNLQLDLLQLRVPGQDPITFGPALAAQQVLGFDPAATTDRIVRTAAGDFVQVVSVPIGGGGGSPLLVGGYNYSDALAYLLRNALGTTGNVMLVVDGQLAGSTLPVPPKQPPVAAAPRPARPPGGMNLPLSPVSVRIAGADMLVAYAPLGDIVGRPDAALGVALPDPVAALGRSLGQSRLITVGVLVLVALGLAWLLFRALTRPLRRLAETARLVTEGDLDAGFHVRGRDEIASLAAALERMRLQLLSQAQSLADTSRRVVSVQDDERRRLARDLHDGIQQQLVSLAVKIRRISEVADPASVRLLPEIAQDAEDSVFALQDLGRGIYPSVLADQGLEPALRAQAGRVPMRIQFTVPPAMAGRRFDRESEAALYFVGLEAVTNAQKHAPQAAVTVSIAVEGSALVLEVRDDGPGFDQGQRSPGVGLRNMSDRVAALGGSLSVETSPGRGTTVRAWVPLGHAPVEALQASPAPNP